jgi:hypothetical protein
VRRVPPRYLSVQLSSYSLDQLFDAKYDPAYMAQIVSAKGRLGGWKWAVLPVALIMAGAFNVRVGRAQTVSTWDQSSQVSLVASSEASMVSASGGAPSTGIMAVPPRLRTKNDEDRGRVRPFSRIAIATDAGTLGFGAHFATPITRRLNLRGGFDLGNFGYAFTQDGVHHAGALQLRSGSVRLEVYPFRTGLHISPGLLVFKSSVGGAISVPGGNSFSMGDATLTSNVANPVTGSEKLVFARSVMPSLTIGFRNMLERKSRRWTVPLEIGAAYTGHYSAQMSLQGSACYKGYCVATSNAMVQASVVQQQNNLNETMKHYQILPIVTGGVSYGF